MGMHGSTDRRQTDRQTTDRAPTQYRLIGLPAKSRQKVVARRSTSDAYRALSIKINMLHCAPKNRAYVLCLVTLATIEQYNYYLTQ